MTTSSEHFAWLSSTDGGNLCIKETASDPYAIIYYKKGHSNMSLPNVLAHRSVIWNKITNKPVLISPGHGRKFVDALPDGVQTSNFTVEEFVDGVMINMFYDHEKHLWRLATRTCMEATNSFYNTHSRSFADLFWETFAMAGLSVETDLDTSEVYSWVLQHPEERIVVPCVYGIPRLALIKLTPTPTYRTPLMTSLCPARYEELSVGTFKLNTLENVYEYIVSTGRRRGTSWQGVVVYPSNSMTRYKLRTAQYDMARHLRGNQAKLAFLWLERWSETRIGTYLKEYPEEQHEANTVIEAFKKSTQEMYDLYQSVFRKHTCTLAQVPRKYRNLLWSAHQQKLGAYFPNMVGFMNRQDTARKLWLVNYDVRYA